MILHVLIAMVAGWLQRHQQHVITYLIVENRVLKAQLGGRRLRLTDTERRRLATLAHPLGRQRLKEVATLATPDTLLRWYKRLIAQKFDGSTQRPQPADPVSRRRSNCSSYAWRKRTQRGAIAASRGPCKSGASHRQADGAQYLAPPSPRARPAPPARRDELDTILKMHWDVLAATDFFTVEVATWHGLVTYYVLVVMELPRGASILPASRRILPRPSCSNAPGS